jgi:hypothetical protein
MHPKFLERLKCEFESENNKKKTRVHSLAHSSFGVKGACWSSEMGTRMSDKWVNYLYGPTQMKQVGYYIVRTLLVHGRTMHGHTQTHKIHHDSSFREATTFPLIVYVINHGGCIQMSFFLGFPSWKSQNSQNWDSRHFGGP